MKRFIITLILILLTISLVNAQEFSPTVDTTSPEGAVVGGTFDIDVVISDAYIENATLEVPEESSPGWGEVEQGYFTFSPRAHTIDVLTEEETKTLTFTVTVADDVPEKVFSIPLAFYGKAGECAEGCRPFRLTYGVSVETVDLDIADDRVGQGDEAYTDESYAAAKVYYEQALTRYQKAGNDDMAASIQDRIDDCETGAEAKQLFDAAMNKHAAGNLEGACKDFADAKELYEELGNEEKVATIDGYLEECGTVTPAPGDDNGAGTTTYLLIGLVLVIMFIGIVAVRAYALKAAVKKYK